MRVLHIIQIFHPSGLLFEAFEAFARLHPQASRLQSGTFFQQMQQRADAEPVLLLAIQAQRLKDPGRWEGEKNGKFKVKNEKSALGEEGGRGGMIEGKGTMMDDRGKMIESGGKMMDDRGVQLDGSLVAGSLLGVIVKVPIPRWMRFWPANTLHERFNSRTIVCGGPLIAPGSRLEQETTLGLLVEELQRKTSGHSRYTQYRNLFDCSEYLPKFKSLGFHFSEDNTPLPDIAAMESLQLKDLPEKGAEKTIPGVKLARYGRFTK